MNIGDYRFILGQVMHHLDEAITEGHKLIRNDQMGRLRDMENALQDIDDSLAEAEAGQ